MRRVTRGGGIPGELELAGDILEEGSIVDKIEEGKDRTCRSALFLAMSPGQPPTLLKPVPSPLESLLPLPDPFTSPLIPT
jgi:hypothetical protein